MSRSLYLEHASVILCVKISPRMSQKQLRFGDDVEECASVGRITVRAMSPPRLADIGVLLQEAEEATRD